MKVFDIDEKRLLPFYGFDSNYLESIEQKLNIFCKQYKVLYLYGAGKYGKSFFELLKKNGIQISGFIVTVSNDVSYLGRPVYDFEKFISNHEAGVGVILSLQEKYQLEVIDKLKLHRIPFLSIPNDLMSAITILRNTNLEALNNNIIKWEIKYPYVDIPQYRWKTILVIQLEVAIGDNIWSSAFIRELRRNFPASNIVYVVSDKMSSLVSHCPYVNRVIYYPLEIGNCNYSEKMRLKAELFATNNLRCLNPDVAFLVKALPCHPSDALENVLLAIYSGARMRVAHIFDVFENEHFFYDKWKTLFPLHDRHCCAEHDVSKDLGLLRVCNLPIADDRMELWISKEIKGRIRKELFHKCANKQIKIAVGVAGRELRRNWPASKYSRLMNKVMRFRDDVIFVIFGGDNAITQSEFIMRNTPNAVSYVNELNLIEAGAAIGACDFYLGSDTSLMHMASAGGLPVIELTANLPDGNDFDQGAPVRTGPWRVHYEVIGPARAKGGCTHLCRKRFIHCMKNISVKCVYEAVRRMLEYIEKGRGSER